MNLPQILFDIHKAGLDVSSANPSRIGFWPLRNFESELNRQGSYSFLWPNKQNPSGYIFYSDLSYSDKTTKQSLEIIHLSVLNKAKGDAKKMWQEFLLGFAGNRPLAIWLEVNEYNHRALKFYFSLGFEKVGIKSKYYPGGDDAWQLKLILKTL